MVEGGAGRKVEGRRRKDEGPKRERGPGASFRCQVPGVRLEPKARGFFDNLMR